LLAAGFLAGLLALGYSLRRSAKTACRLAFASVLALAAVLVAHPFRANLHSGSLEATVLDVGQGDSIFVAAPGGRTLLVDGGGAVGAFRIRGMRTRFDIGEEVVSRYLWSRGITKLDAVALTHAHEDHLEGLTAVLENFQVGELWVGHDVNSGAYRNLLVAAQRRGTRVVHWKQGDSLDFAGAQINVLWPASDDAVREAQNDDSLVLRLSYKNESVLLAGDIEHGVEAKLADDSRLLTADFLKVAHHGSKTSSTTEFLDRVRPSFAAISVGENNAFGHPSEITLEHLRDARVEVLRTDRDGAITFLGNGSSEQISSFRGPASIARPNSLALRPAPKESSAPPH
jgi:competence protein ComEC